MTKLNIISAFIGCLSILSTSNAFAVVGSSAKISSPAITTGTELYSRENNNNNNNDNDNQNDYNIYTNRRNFLSKSIGVGIIGGAAVSTVATATTPAPAFAAADTSGEAQDMTSQMFNEDGSLKSGAMTSNGMTENVEATETTVTLQFPSISSSSSSSDAAIVSVDGNSPTIGGTTTTVESSSPSSSSSSSPSMIKASYQIPDKWTPAPEYIDTLLSSREKACDHITVYQVPGTFKDNSILEKATTIGVAKALNFASTGPGVFPKALSTADIVSGRKVSKEVSSSSSSNKTNTDGGGSSSSSSSKDGKKQKYYEFDLAVAPDQCGQSAENLNLGFCPYDTIVLISATIVNEKMMVCGVTCTKNEWKRANADLKRVRGSFFVEEGGVVA